MSKIEVLYEVKKMQISTINTLAGTDDQFMKSSKTALNSALGADGVAARMQTVNVLPFVSNVNASLISNGISFTQLSESALAAGAISVISKSPPSTYSAITTVADLGSIGSIGSDGLSRVTFSLQGDHSLGVISAVSTLELKPQVQPVALDGNRGSSEAPLHGAGVTPTKLAQNATIDLSQIPLGTPAAGIESAVDKSAPNAMVGAPKILAVDPILLQTINDAYISAGLLVAAKSGAISPSEALLSLGNRAESMPIRSDLVSGITVSGTADAVSIGFLMRASAQASQGNVPSEANLATENARSILSRNFLLNKEEMELLPLFMTEVTNLPSGDLQIRLTGVAVMENQAAPGTLILGG